MSDEPSTPLDLASIQQDLARSFLPAWAKESDDSERLFRMAENYDPGDRREPTGRGRGDRGPRHDRPPGRGPRPDRPPGRGPGPDRAPGRGMGGRGMGRRHDRPADRRAERPAPPPALSGWDIRFKPDPRGVEGVAKQIKAVAQAYRLFDLAWLVLAKPERYRVEFRRTSADSTDLFQARFDGSVWLSEREAATHVVAHNFEKFYRRDRVTVDPPKGAYAFVAVCGMSGVLLGPPNYHDYQAKLRKLHAERFSDMPFDAFKNRIRMDRDEAAVQKWKDELSQKEVFYPADTPEGAEPVKLDSIAELERHFLQNHAAACISRIVERAIVPGPTALSASAPGARALVRRALDELNQFPLPLAHILGQQLVSKGLKVFKAHGNITYASVAQPKHLDRQAQPVADGVSGILEYLEKHASTPRAEQWKALVGLRPIPAGGTDAERESSVTADLLWLLHEGHVTDYARRGLEAAARPKTPPVRKRESRRGTPNPGTPDSPATSPKALPEAETEALPETPAPPVADVREVAQDSETADTSPSAMTS